MRGEKEIVKGVYHAGDRVLKSGWSTTRIASWKAINEVLSEAGWMASSCMHQL